MTTSTSTSPSRPSTTRMSSWWGRCWPPRCIAKQSVTLTRPPAAENVVSSTSEPSRYRRVQVASRSLGRMEKYPPRSQSRMRPKVLAASKRRRHSQSIDPERPTSPEERYPDIGSYALIGDCHSSGLVGRSGSIDWLCLRRFDAASTFGRILDWDRGGYFSIRPSDREATCTRRYLDGSLVLETTFSAAGGRVSVTDCFAMQRGGQHRPHHELIRVVEGLEGEVDVDVVIEPRFDYGALRPWVRLHDTGAYSAVGGDTAIVVCTPGPVHFDDSEHDRLWTTIPVRAGERFAFSI